MYFDDGILSTQQDFDPDFAINNQNIRANVSDVIHILEIGQNILVRVYDQMGKYTDTEFISKELIDCSYTCFKLEENTESCNIYMNFNDNIFNNWMKADSKTYIITKQFILQAIDRYDYDFKDISHINIANIMSLLMSEPDLECSNNDKMVVLNSGINSETLISSQQHKIKCGDAEDVMLQKIECEKYINYYFFNNILLVEYDLHSAIAPFSSPLVDGKYMHYKFLDEQELDLCIVSTIEFENNVEQLVQNKIDIMLPTESDNVIQDHEHKIRIRYNDLLKSKILFINNNDSMSAYMINNNFVVKLDDNIWNNRDKINIEQYSIDTLSDNLCKLTLDNRIDDVILTQDIDEESVRQINLNNVSYKDIFTSSDSKYDLQISDNRVEIISDHFKKLLINDGKWVRFTKNIRQNIHFHISRQYYRDSKELPFKYDFMTGEFNSIIVLINDCSNDFDVDVDVTQQHVMYSHDINDHHIYLDIDDIHSAGRYKCVLGDEMDEMNRMDEMNEIDEMDGFIEISGIFPYSWKTDLARINDVNSRVVIEFGQKKSATVILS